MKFREHRGGLSESMGTTVELDTKEDFLKHIEKLARQIVPKDDFTVSFEQYAFDSRINWNTWIVMLEGHGVLGIMDGPIPASWKPKIEFVWASESRVID